jgi:hypothetical protein
MLAAACVELQGAVDQQHSQCHRADDTPDQQVPQTQQLLQVLQQQTMQNQLPSVMHELQQQHGSVMAKLKRTQREQCRLLERKIECDRCITMLQQHLSKKRHSKHTMATLTVQPAQTAAATEAALGCSSESTLAAAVAAAYAAGSGTSSSCIAGGSTSSNSGSSLGSVVSGLLSSSGGKGMPWLAGDGKQPINKLLQALRERQASQQAASAQVCRRCYTWKTIRRYPEAGFVAT